MAEIQKIFQAIPKVLGLGSLIATVRAGTGVDPMPTDPVMRTYVAGVTAATRSGTGKPVDPRQFIDLGNGPIAGEIFATALFGSGSAYFREGMWVGGDRDPKFRHVPLATFLESTHGLVDDSAGILERHLRELERSLNREALAAQTHRSRLLMSALAGTVMALLAGLWLTLRVGRNLRLWRRASESDTLTALPNRAGLRTAVAPWFASKSRTLGVAVVDIDHFKSINDNYGHEAGDQLLVGIVQRISSSVVASSTAVARWGGDEFVLVFRLDAGAAIDDLGAVLRRVTDSLGEPFDLGPTMVVSSVSIGAVVCECGGCDLEDLFRTADHGLYEVKKAGRNNFVVGHCTKHERTETILRTETNDPHDVLAGSVSG